MSTPERDRLAGLALSRAAVDRAAEHRADEAWLECAWRSADARVVRTSNGAAAVDTTDAGDPHLAMDARPDVPPDRRIFLGVDGPVPFFGVEVDDTDDTFRALREIGLLLPDRDAGLVVHAVALANWHATHRHCPRCGGPTRVGSAGHTRICLLDGSEHYPRTDPAVIMTVVDGADRLLLGRQTAWPERRFSTLAGFVEPGESLEQAVRREVDEEVGVRVDEVRYLGSQPWPFPSSLMLGFAARAATVEIDLRDGEVAEARWFTRATLQDAVRRGEILLSPPVSIARRLVEHWYGDVIADAQEAWR